MLTKEIHLLLDAAGALIVFQEKGAPWAGVLASFAGVTAVLTLLAARGTPARRCALYATASAIVGGLEASFIKTAADVFATHGLQAIPAQNT